MKQAIKFRIKLLVGLVVYVLRIRPDATLAILIGIISSTLEVAGLAVLMPLTSIAANIPVSESSPWTRLAEYFGGHPTAHFYAVAFFALLLARTITQMINNVMSNLIMRQINAHFSIHALEAFIHHLHFSQVQKESIGHFVSVAGEEAMRAATIVNSIIRLIPLLFLFLLYLAMITRQSWQASLGFVVFCIVVSTCLLGAFRKALELGARQQQQTRAAGTHFIESLNGLRTVRSFNAEKYVVARYAQMMTQYMRTLFYGDAVNNFGGAIPTLLLAVGMLFMTAILISPAQLTALLPGIIVGIMMVLRLLPLATQTLEISMRLASDLKAAESISEMLEAVKSAHIAEAHSLPGLEEPVREIEFDNVSFRYSADTPEVLQSFRTQFVAGKSYAISGPSGAGKSTIVDLLLKFYSQYDGVIRINGKDIRSLSQESLRRRIVLAEQAVRIFYDTIENNVQFGREASSSDVAKALDMVGLSEFIATLPQGQMTLLNYQGGNVSGGQRQRIGLARALLLKADVLIMDESTSALDKATRDRVLSRLLPLYRDRIVIFIAHDPAILGIVDEVVHLGHEAILTAATAS